MVGELGLSGVAVTVMGSAGFEVIAFSDDRAKALEDLQFVLGEGPTGDAYRAARPVLVADVSSAGLRWVQFASAAQSQGVGGIYAFPLQLGGVRSGVLTAHCGSGRSLDGSQLRRCLVLADSARDVLLGAVDDSQDEAHDLSRFLALRTVVYQAQGMLMVALDVSLEEALARLRAMAYAESMDLNKLAAELASGQRPMPVDRGAQ